MREPEFFDYVSSSDETIIVARRLGDRVGGVFWIAAWLLIASRTALTDAVFNALTDGFVNVLPVLDSVGQHGFDHGFKGTGNCVDQAVAFFLGEDFVDQNVGLDEVAVVFTQGVCLTD